MFPSCLKLAKVVPIHKDGSIDTPGNFRPISLTSVTAKVIEKLVKKRLVKFLDKNCILSNFQFGYR